MTSLIQRYCSYLSWLVLLFWVAPQAWGAELTAQVDRQEIGVDETLQLIVRIDEQVSYGNPDFSDLEIQFDILNQQRSNQFRAINGRTEGWTQWSLTLAPRETGELTIPALSFQGEQSEAITIQVSKTSTATGNDSELYAEVSLNKERLFVQEELLVTVRVYSAVTLREFGEVEPFTMDNALVEKLSQTGYRKRMGDRIYKVEETVYGVYPQESGELTIPQRQWMAVVVDQANNFRNDPFFTPRGEMRRIRSQAKTVRVDPKPVNYRGRDWLPARQVTLEQHWSRGPERFVVGEPITRSVTIKAEGLKASQIPPLPPLSHPQVRSYSDQPQYDEQPSVQGMTSARIESLAIIANQAGEFTLPAVEVDWWDTQAGRMRTASLPAQTISVAPAPGSPATPAVPTPSANNRDTRSADPGGETSAKQHAIWFWPLLISNISIAVLAMIFCIAWWRERKHTYSDSSEPATATSPRAINQVFHQLRRACSEGDAAQVRQLLGEWGQRFWQLPHTASLADIRQQADYPPLSQELATLDKILYGNQPTGQWDGKPLWRALVEVKQQQQRRGSDTHTADHIPPLYPSH